MHLPHQKLILFGWASVICMAGCGEGPAGSDAASASNVSRKPKEAAQPLEAVFASAPMEVKDNATIASEALKNADYEKAVVSLQVITDQGNLTLDQGMAIHQSKVALESRLISAMAQGDENARRAYELLKKSKRQ